MRRAILHIAMCLLLALAPLACVPSSMDGGLPSTEVQLTDVGNSEDPDGVMKTYVNPEFEVKIQYWGEWDLEEQGTERAIFSSGEGEEVGADFMWITVTFDQFLADAGIDAADLTEFPSEFDKTLCAASESLGDGMMSITCYHTYEFEKGKFVVTVAGVMLDSTPPMYSWPYGVYKVDHERIGEIQVDMPTPERYTPPGTGEDKEEPEVVPRPDAPIILDHTAPIK